MHHDPERNVLWVTCPIEDFASQLKIDETASRLLLVRIKSKLLSARRERRPTPIVDQTLYTGWNAMFVSAYFEAARVLNRKDCRDFALKTLNRIISQAWNESTGFLHRIGGPRLDGTLDDQVFAIAALLDAWETTLDHRYFEIAERAMRLTVERFGDPESGGFFDRAQDAAPMGGLDIRRKPVQDSPTPAGNSVAAIVLDRLHALTGEKLYRDWAEKTLRSVRRAGAEVWTFRSNLRPSNFASRPPSIADRDHRRCRDSSAAELERTSAETYRFGKTVLRLTPEQLAANNLPPALRETLPNLNRNVATSTGLR